MDESARAELYHTGTSVICNRFFIGLIGLIALTHKRIAILRYSDANTPLPAVDEDSAKHQATILAQA